MRSIEKGVLMKTYIYPENLRATVRLWFWSVRDFCILCGGIIVAVALFAKLQTLVPAAAVVCFAFLTFRTEDTAVIDYMTAAVRYFLLTQQAFEWEETYEDQKEKRTKTDRL